ncbi:MAG TPA: TetR/AcrR family transcriptional regulator [Pseudonocardiaceae bacterium]|nr:TetR/AcrR family transcriptional regulator [Pseudonocardiaceae bacterium]
MAERRRGATLEQAILRAAADELVASGYPGLTMDRVARRAGTNKNAIYRRWPHRAALGVAAYQLLVGDRMRSPGDTGSLRGDALVLLRQMNRDLASPRGEILRGLLAAVNDEPELLDLLRERAVDGGTDVWLALLRRAVDRGEAADAALHPRVATVALSLLRNEYVTRGMARIPDDVVVEIVDEVFLPLIRGRS